MGNLSGGSNFYKGALKIMLDKKDRFLPGETITGRVVADKRFKNTSVQLQMIGMEHWDWHRD